MQTARASQAHAFVLSLLDQDGIPIEAVSGDFTLRAARNGVSVDMPSYTVVCIDEDYALWSIRIAGGFELTGLWHVFAIVHGRTYGEAVRVSTHDVDTLATEIQQVGAGAGTYALTVTVLDTEDEPIHDARITATPSGGGAVIAGARTNTDGSASLLLDAGTWEVRAWAPGYRFSASTVILSADDDLTINGETLAVEPPEDPALCRLYAWFRDMSNIPQAGVIVHVHNLQRPTTTEEGVGISEILRTLTSDEDGYMSVDLLRGMRVQITITGSNFTRELVVPDQDTANLLTLSGLIADSFAIGTR